MIGITTKLANVLLHPLKSLDLILETIVSAASFGDLLRGKETIRADTVVEIHYNDVVVAGLDQAGTVVVGVRVCVESSTLDEEVYRQWMTCCGIRWSVDVHKETILG